MKRILTQLEIDSLIEVINNNKLSEWLASNGENEEDNKAEYPSSQLAKIYAIRDYNLFCTTYPLENLTKNTSVLRRYAYKDMYSFKNFKYFMMIENYAYRAMNLVSVVGLPTIVLDSPNYNYARLRHHEPIFLVDVTSLSYYMDAFVQEKYFMDIFVGTFVKEKI